MPFMVMGAMGALSQATQGIQPSPAYNALIALGCVAALAVWGANNVYLQGTRGWSLGKRVCHIVVLGPDGEVLGIGRTILRELFKATVSSCVCNLGFFWMLWDDQAQTWHDKIAGSHVYYN